MAPTQEQGRQSPVFRVPTLPRGSPRYPTSERASSSALAGVSPMRRTL